MPSTGFYLNDWLELGNGIFQAFYEPETPAPHITNWNAVIEVGNSSSEYHCMLDFGGSSFYKRDEVEGGFSEARLVVEKVLMDTFNLKPLPPAGSLTSEEIKAKMDRYNAAVTLYRQYVSKGFRNIQPPLINLFNDPKYVWVPADAFGKIVDVSKPPSRRWF